MNYLSKNQVLVNLQTFLNSLIRFAQTLEASGFIEILADKQEEKLENINKSNQISILYKTTEVLYHHKLLDNPEFRGILKSFNYNVSISIPSSIAFIDFSAFKNCSSLSEVLLPNSIKTIKDNAFE